MNRTLLIIFLLIPICFYAQIKRTRNFIWFTPTGKNHVTINGLAVGPMAMPGAEGHLQINGVNIEFLPVAIFALPQILGETMINVMTEEAYPKKTEVVTIVHGLTISGSFQDIEMHGVSLNLATYTNHSYGLETSFWTNANYLFSGVQLSLMGNIATKGKGFQLGLFNSCEDCSVLQIGLVNRIGSRVLPLINFNFKKSKQQAIIDTKPFHTDEVPATPSETSPASENQNK